MNAAVQRRPIEVLLWVISWVASFMGPIPLLTPDLHPKPRPFSPLRERLETPANAPHSFGMLAAMLFAYSELFWVSIISFLIARPGGVHCPPITRTRPVRSARRIETSRRCSRIRAIKPSASALITATTWA
jgi:hypothetical protein